MCERPGRTRVRYCTEYSDGRQASIRQMEDVVWVLRSDPKLNQIDFVPASELRERDRYVLEDEQSQAYWPAPRNSLRPERVRRNRPPELMSSCLTSSA